MVFNKKGLATYILILLIVSFLMTILIVSIMSVFFAPDHEKCKDFEFDIEKKCLRDNQLSVRIKNTGNNKLTFQSNLPETRSYDVMTEQTVDLLFPARESDITIYPVVVPAIVGDEISICKGKSDKTVVARLIKC